MTSILQKFKINRECTLFVTSVALWTSIHAQESGKLGEKYADAYKKYLSAACPIVKDSIQHFVYFSRDREAIINHPFLLHPAFKGAQIMYSWKDFEQQKGKYDFSLLKKDGRFSNHAKRRCLFMHSQLYRWFLRNTWDK